MIGLQNRLCGYLVVATISATCVGCATSSQPVDKPGAKDTDAELAEAKRKVAVHPWHTQRVDNIGNEGLQQTIENLANFDDDQFATTGWGIGVMGRHFRIGNPADEMFRLTHLFRVRKLLEIGREASEEVTPVLRNALNEALTDWPRALTQMQKMWAEHPDGFSTEGPTDYEKTALKAMASTYLLAELHDFDSLALLVHSYKLHTKWIAEHKHYPCPQVAIPQAITLYAIHRLVSGYRAERLTSQARGIHKEYLRWAKSEIPPPLKFSCSRWDADYDESDPLVQILDPNGIVLRDQPKIELVVYPTRFMDGEPMQDGHTQKVAEKSKVWFTKLAQFVETAYPDANLVADN